MKDNKKRKIEDLVDFSVIKAASEGDAEAIMAVLKHYEAYIAKLSLRWEYNDKGQLCCYVDEEKRKWLEIVLVLKLLEFKPIREA